MAFNVSIFSHSKYSFEGKREHEEVEIFLYSHWIIMALKVLFYAILAFLPLIPLLIFAQTLINFEVIIYVPFFLLFYYMMLWSLFFYEVMIYLLDTWIVTNERILDIVQKNFFYRTVSELDLTDRKSVV